MRKRMVLVLCAALALTVGAATATAGQSAACPVLSSAQVRNVTGSFLRVQLLPKSRAQSAPSCWFALATSGAGGFATLGVHRYPARAYTEQVAAIRASNKSKAPKDRTQVTPIRALGNQAWRISSNVLDPYLIVIKGTRGLSIEGNDEAWKDGLINAARLRTLALVVASRI
jgi:hypothetical protein